MLNLEQVKQLEARIAKAINYIERIAKEKGEMLQREAEMGAKLSAFQKQEAELKARLESYQGRIDELELHISRFKEEQGKIEESILSALDRLSRFEKDMEKSLKEKPGAPGAGGSDPAGGATKTAPSLASEKPRAERETGGGEPENEGSPDDVHDPLVDLPYGAENKDDPQENGEELDIF